MDYIHKVCYSSFESERRGKTVTFGGYDDKVAERKSTASTHRILELQWSVSQMPNTEIEAIR